MKSRHVRDEIVLPFGNEPGAKYIALSHFRFM